MHLFSAAALLKSDAIDVFGELVKTACDYQDFVAVQNYIDKLKKLAKTVPLRDISASKMAETFVHKCVFSNVSFKSLFVNSRKSFTMKLFRSVSRVLHTQNSFLAIFHPLKTVQVKGLDCTLIGTIRSYLNDRHINGEL